MDLDRLLIYKRPLKLTTFAAIMSVANTLLYNLPFFSFAISHASMGAFAKVLLVASLAVLMLAVNFMMCYLLIYLCRIVGRVLIAVCHLLSAACTYYVFKMHIIMDETMLGNVFNTRYSEASGFITWGAFFFVLVFGVLPAVYVIVQKIDYGSLRRFGINIGASLLLVVASILPNVGQALWISKYDTELGGLLMPWSYLANSLRLASMSHSKNAEEIKLPDATFADSSKTAVVLVIGESARRANFQLYGYPRATNPCLSQRDDLLVYPALSCNTFTTACLKGMLEYKDTSTLFEILPNYLYRAGADVAWHATNWGEPPVHIDDYVDLRQLEEMYPDERPILDEALLRGLKQRIATSSRNKVFVVLHTNTNHGPCYSSKYPKAFEHFAPVCSNIENARDSLPELVNAYDNSIVYVDYLLNDLIDTLQSLDGWNAAMLYVSDHGESLGENKLFMHGVPMNMAPAEQYEIPFIVWTTPGFRTPKSIGTVVDQHYIYHTVLNLLSVESPIYDAAHDLFEQPERE